MRRFPFLTTILLPCQTTTLTAQIRESLLQRLRGIDVSCGNVGALADSLEALLKSAQSLSLTTHGLVCQPSPFHSQTLSPLQGTLTGELEMMVQRFRDCSVSLDPVSATVLARLLFSNLGRGIKVSPQTSPQAGAVTV